MDNGKEKEDLSSKIMTPEEEAAMEAMARQRSSRRAMAFYKPGVSPTESPIREASNSGLSEPSSSQPMGKILRHSSRLRIGYADTIGKRPTMEDDITIVGRLRGRDDEDFVALYDGHGGKASAEFAAKNLHKVLEDKLNEGVSPEHSLKSAFIFTNEMMKIQNVSGGTTAITAFCTKDKCLIANAGDSRAVLLRDNQAIRLSNDHKPDSPEEEARIVKAGGYVTKQSNKTGKTICRVNGLLSVSRALGDLFLQPYVTPEPEITQFPLSSKSQLLILACDGLWDVVTDEEAVEIASSEDDPEKAAIKLRDTALSYGSTDNISVIVVQIPAVSRTRQEITHVSKKGKLSQRMVFTIFMVTAAVVAVGYSIVNGTSTFRS